MKRSLFTLLLSAFAFASMAQNDDSFEAYRRSLYAGMAHFRDSVMTDYKSFRQRINADYADFLRGIWKEEKALPAPPPIEDPTPVEPVVCPKEDEDRTIDSTPVVIEEEVNPIHAPEPQPQPVAPIEEEQPSPVTPPILYNFNFYGTDLHVRLAPSQRFTLKSISPKAMGNAWDRLSEDDYTNLLYDCLMIRQEYALCDWAYLLMLNTLSESFLGKGTNEATFLTAYIFCQSGYRIRLAKDAEILYLLVGTPHQLYNHGYYRIDGLQYFVFNATPQQLYVCDVEFEGERSLSLYIPILPKLAEDHSEKRIIRSDRYPDIAVSSQVNRNIINFMNDYPTSFFGDNVLTRWAIYAETPVCTPAEQTVVNALRSKTAGLPEPEALNVILNFVQTGFVYEYDDKVWGGDRAFFADETLYYPYCDCEDRSILFSRLVRNILGLKVMLVYYPGHLATAVRTTTPMQGDYIQHGNDRYIICDPTFIGAPVGRTMTGMNNSTASVIVLG